MSSSMMLMIVESKAKSATIQKYLQSEAGHMGQWVVMPCYGHIYDLPEKSLGYDENTYTPSYILKSKAATTLLSKAKSATRIFLAADPDREGEAIAAHLYHHFQSHGVSPNRMCRVAFHEITKRALLEAINSPRAIDQALVEAQETRRVLDRMVGFKISPMLWRYFPESGLSAGRVQTAALQMIVQATEAAQKWEPVATYPLDAEVNFPQKSALVWSVTAQSDPLPEGQIPGAIRSLVEWSQRNAAKAQLSTALRTVKPPPPYVTSTLQQDASQKLRISIKKVMSIAQELYEGGFITYMRTDSPNLSKLAMQGAREYIIQTFGESMSHPRVYASKSAHSQEAHEAIRPTYFDLQKALGKLDGAKEALYKLIFARTIASQMAPAEYRDYILHVHAQDTPFKGRKSVQLHKGFMLAYHSESDTGSERELSSKQRALLEAIPCDAPPMPADVLEVTASPTFPSPPTLYTEASLVRDMEKSGIGRPSTYAATLEKLAQRAYTEVTIFPARMYTGTHYACKTGSALTVKTSPITKTFFGEKRLLPTDLGVRVIQYLQPRFSFLCNLEFTSSMEEDMDRICAREKTKQDICKTLSDHIKANIQKCKEEPKPDRPPKKTQNQPIALTDTINLCVTRYGPCLERNKTYIDLKAFLQWKKKPLEQVTCEDAEFLFSLPKELPDGNQLCYGRYGLYLKTAEGKNLRLDKKEWDGFMS